MIWTLKSPALLIAVASLALVTACGAAAREIKPAAKVVAAPTSPTPIPLATSPPLPTSTVAPAATPSPAATAPPATATPSAAPASSPTATPSPAPQAAVTLYNIASSDWSSVAHLRPGPDGTLWFTTEGMASSEFGSITTAGVVTSWPVPWANGDGDMDDFTFGDGFLWSVDVHALNDSYIGQWTLSGTLLDEFPVPWTAYAIAWGPDGALWFSGASVSGMDLSLSYVGRMTVKGAVATYSLPDTSSLAGDLTVGPDGAIWFSELPGSHVGRVTTSGAITEYEVPHDENIGGPDAGNQTIVVGPDGAIWAIVDEVLVRVTTSGTVSVIPAASPMSLSTNPDGDIWYLGFSQPGDAVVISMSTSGVRLAEYSIDDSGLTAIASGSDGMIWFGDNFGQNDDVARLDPSIPPNE